ncbi:hypothetical protein DFAR_2720009 [Desulfarculales bacterium]
MLWPDRLAGLAMDGFAAYMIL